MKKGQTLLEYILIYVLIGVVVIAFVTRFDIRKMRNYSVFGSEDANQKGVLVIPAMTR